MSFWDSTIYGLIQGFTEFAPVSSSGHLALLPHFLNIQDPGISFDLLMHIGTALAVMVYYFRELRKVFFSLPKFISAPVREQKETALLKNILVSTFVSVIIILCIKDLAQNYGRNPTSIAGGLIIFGFLMWWLDRRGTSHERAIEENLFTKFCPKTAALIGVAQSIAVFPGVSRSGATITMARFQNLGRKEAGHFSFLISLPIIIAGAVHKLPGWSGLGEELPVALWGVFVSFISGLVTIHFFLKFIQKFGLGGFFIYRLILAIIVLTSL